jgi:hypothetical protein
VRHGVPGDDGRPGLAADDARSDGHG